MARESNNTSEQREILDYQVMLMYSTFLMYTEQLQKWKENKSKHWEAGSKHTSKELPALFNTTPPELLKEFHFSFKTANYTITDHPHTTPTRLIPKLLHSVINNLLFQHNNANHYKGIKKPPMKLAIGITENSKQN